MYIPNVQYLVIPDKSITQIKNILELSHPNSGAHNPSTG